MKRLTRKAGLREYGFLNARRDENWKMTVIHGLGVAGSVALGKTLFSLFVANGASMVAQF